MKDDLILTTRKPSNEDNMIPLINIVFLLLIFYMVAGQIKTFQAEGIELPLSSQSISTELTAIQLQINNKNQIYFNEAIVTLDQFDAKLAALKDIKISLHVDKGITAEQLDKIMDILRKNSITTIKLYTKEPEQK